MKMLLKHRHQGRVLWTECPERTKILKTFYISERYGERIFKKRNKMSEKGRKDREKQWGLE